MQQQKLRHLDAFLLQGGNYYTLEDYPSYVREHEQEAREYYAQEISLSSDDFIRMLLFDAAFIGEYFLWFTVGSDVVDRNIEVFHKVRRDLVLEENQVPFFILKGLYNLAFTSGTGDSNYHLFFIYVACEFVCNLSNLERNTAFEKLVIDAATIKHLVDCLRICLPSILRGQLPSCNNNKNLKYQLPMSTSELSAAGVKFASGSKNLLDVRFVNGVLEIPTFKVDDSTEYTFRSILALEQFHYHHDSYLLITYSFLIG